MLQWPADMQLSPDKALGQQYEQGFQPQLQDTPRYNKGPTADHSSTHVLALSLSSLILSSTVGSQLPQLSLDPRDLIPSSSHVHAVIYDDEPDDLPTGVMLQDLSKYITKDGIYPAARGGFGEIWKCTISCTDRSSVKVAVKAFQLYVEEELPAKTKKIRRIKRELGISANLKHTNILPIYGYAHGFSPLIAIVSPWAVNGDLSDYLKRKGATLTLVLRLQLLRDIIAGLQYLHANSVIHGDFTSVNVLIHGDGTACIADFGLSLMYSEVINVSQASWTSALHGNIRWMAPELLVPGGEDGPLIRPSKQSDIYSFGCIMLEVLTNKIPYHYLVNNNTVLMSIISSQKPSRVYYPGLPGKYWSFIEKCWSTKPRDRPSTEEADVAIRDIYLAVQS
ncbi:kinase-like domain-containing protein [Suillus bovinus]|uniref:kinase-like domain-containing protein n=1 Tax=Suillus bovinus TaxID=48563 RepID=UPI001B86E9EF|nr:kinase-like domain-containing protein [Suillus bovinus]KAG2138079.1 kinase-like domain-containing protein [Suillus bovinus]